MEEIVKQSWKSWANKWDQENPSDFKKACNDSRIRQEAAIYQRESTKRMTKLLEQEQERIKVIQEQERIKVIQEQKEVEKKD
jgi:hypothetical protein